MLQLAHFSIMILLIVLNLDQVHPFSTMMSLFWILNNASHNQTYKGHRCLDDDDSVKLLNDIERRKLEISELLKLGRTIIIFTPHDTICYVDSGKREYSGTGKNRQTTRLVNAVNLLSVLPVRISTIQGPHFIPYFIQKKSMHFIRL